MSALSSDGLSCLPLSHCYNIVHESRQAALDSSFPNLNWLTQLNTKQRSRLQCVLQKCRCIFCKYCSDTCLSLFFSFLDLVDRFVSAKLLSPRTTSPTVSANPGKLSGCGSVYADSSMNLLKFSVSHLFVAD